MDNENFEKIVDEAIEIIKKSLKSKGKEYAGSNEDRLVNFKRGGEMDRCTPEAALKGYYLKHIVSIFEIINQIDEENKKIGLQFVVNPEHLGILWATVEEKIKDLINYPILLKAILKERYEHGKIR